VERLYALWRAFQDKFLGRACALLLIGCTLLALLEVLRRYVLGASFHWQQDAVTYVLVSAVFLYFGISQRHNEHLNVTVVLELLQSLGPRGRRAVEWIKLLAMVISFVFMALVVWWGYPEVEDSITYASRTESLEFPLWPFLAALLLGFGIMVVTIAFQLWFEIQKLRGRPVPEEERLIDRMRD
jgi:TRAP-type C4-dicarboxylate transport system permease small subunit